ncbi:MAG: glycosyltransferase [Candidatus Kerfeldbacteria bacterium]|nr:glycosyltransferase [Candidatus Kerfeldbacteria bacterium]
MKYLSHLEAQDMGNLLSLKRKRGITLSLALPVLNEEATVGRVIECALSCQPLIDEIIVLDSGSTDNTLRVCAGYNVRFVSDEDTARDLAVALSRGKGWNLWSSVYLTKGDVVAWIDTDIENIHPRFILGIVAPFLMFSDVQFAKGYYRRPKGDARVTEILARPFLNMLFPETAGFIQPLSGEYAGRREFLEQASFYSGYSIEVALLLQAILECGDDKVAQVFLDQRFHPLQDVSSLGKMASNILYTLLHLAEKYKRLSLNVAVGQYVQVFNAVINGGGDISPERIFIADAALPKIVDLPGYR